MRGRHQRPHFGVAGPGITDDDALHRRLEQLHEPVVDTALHQDSAARAAVLAGVVEHPGRRAVAAARSRSQSAKTMLALLPPSSSVTRLTCAAAPAITFLPTSVDPVNTILRHAGMGDKPLPHHRALAGQHLQQVASSPASTASSPSRMVVSGVHSAGLTSTALPAASAGRDAPGRDHHREVPRRDHADHAQRFVEGDVESASNGNLLAGQALRAARVERQHVADMAGFPFGRRRWGARNWPPPARPARRRGRRRRRRTPARPAARSAGDNRAQRRWAARARATASSTAAASTWSTDRSTSSVAGLISCAESHRAPA